MIDVVEWFKTNLLWTAGIYVFIAIAVVGICAWFWYPPLFYWLVIPFFIFCLYFFRNPVRTCPQAVGGSEVLVAPADGKVMAVDRIDMSDGDEEYRTRVSIFLSVFDVHVQWIPCPGVIERVRYTPGKFAVAFAEKSSEINERNEIIIRARTGKCIAVRQIAGLIARRIVCWVKSGDTVKYEQKFGMIRFGSRVDILMPKDIEVLVSVGDRVVGGQDVIGRWED